MNLYIDIETIPSQDERVKADIAASIHAPANYKKEEAIQKWFAEHEEEEFNKAYRKTALNGLVGEIICISWALDYGPVQHVYRNNEIGTEAELLDDDEEDVYRVGEVGTEAELLVGFMLALRKGLALSHTDKLIEPVWIGHYITGFDLRFLWQRYIIRKVIPLVSIPFDAKPWDKTVYDTKIKLSGMQSTGYGSLDEVSKIMGHMPKGDITGATVWDAWLAGRFEDIAEYCDDDVERVRDLHKRMTFSA